MERSFSYKGENGLLEARRKEVAYEEKNDHSTHRRRPSRYYTYS